LKYTLKPYPAYKDSYVPWLGEVPEHWSLPRTKRLLRERVQKGFPNEPLLAATQTKGVVLKDQYENRTVLALKDLELLKLVKVNDFVISLRSFQGGIEYSRAQGIISPAYTVLYPINHSYHGYLAWLFKSRPYIENLTLHVTGIRQGQNVDYVKLSRTILPLPPLPEQAAIARYLDYVDRLIRRYINAKKKLIVLLNEQKQAIIHQAVTRGLDLNVRLKPSGVEWLGDIPEHWEVRKLKFIKKPIPNSFVDGPFGSNLKSEHYVIGGDVYVVESGFITSGQFIRRKFKTITNDHFQTIKRSACSGGDIIIAKIGAHYGMAGILPDLDKPAVVSGNSLKLTVNERIANSRYVHEAILTARAFGALEIIVNATAQPALSLGGLNDLSLPFPPLLEQVRLMDHLDKETEYFDTAISAIQREIDLLREYRTRLTAEVVTGKLDVREATANLPEEAEKEPIEEVELLNENGTAVEDGEEALTGATDDD
jgi:type I restriction enzyme S subunit